MTPGHLNELEVSVLQFGIVGDPVEDVLLLFR